MERGIYKHIEEILRDYPYIDQYVHERRQELLYPHNEFPDENIGGGRSNVPGKPVEDLIITITDDRRLAALEKNKRVVQECLDCTDFDTNYIINELYFKKHPTLTLSGVAESSHMSMATIKRKRTEFFESIKDKFGW